jgi:hypothetical protein
MVEQPVRQAVMGSAEGWRWLSRASTGDEACLLLLGGPGLLHGRWLAGRQERSLASQWEATQHWLWWATSSMGCRAKAGLCYVG